MRWGVRRSSKSSTKKNTSKLDSHPALIKYGKESVRKHRRLRAKLDIHHIDVKTGKYTHQNKTAKAMRTVDKVYDAAKGTALIAVSVLGG